MFMFGLKSDATAASAGAAAHHRAGAGRSGVQRPVVTPSTRVNVEEEHHAAAVIRAMFAGAATTHPEFRRAARFGHRYPQTAVEGGSAAAWGS
jgi:hypothetical protein